MNGFSSHTYSWINAGGERFWVKYHFKTVQGIENLTEDEAARLAGEDGDHHRRDLHRRDRRRRRAGVDASACRSCRSPTPPDYRFNPFDLTKVWPQGDYPLIEVGRMVLDRNPENFFAEVEQASFNPSNLVPGHRPVARPDADGADLQLPRHPPAPHRPELRAAADQPPAVPRPLLQQGRADDLPPRGRPAGLRAELLRRPGGRPGEGHRDRLGRRRRRARAHGLRQARRGRRLRPARHARARRDGRRGSARRSSRTSSATPPTRCRRRCSCA